MFNLHEKVDNDLTIDEVSTAFWTQYPDADKTIYGKIIDDIKNINISADSGRVILSELKAKKNAFELSEAFFLVSQGKQSLSDVLDRCKTIEVGHEEKELPLKEVSNSVTEIIKGIKAERGFRWRLDCLNKSLGSLRTGDFGFIFARPETGKTTFLASEAAEFLVQSNRDDRPIVWLNNEEQGYKVMFRMYQAYFGITSKQLLENPAFYEGLFKEQVGSRFRQFDSATIHRRDVEKIVEKLDPAIVIYDQLPKITGFSDDRDDLRLGSIFQWGRELAKDRHAGIGVSQANGMGEGVKYLTMDHVANAKTAVQAEADWILGIGAVHDEVSPNARYLNICKNKLLGDADSIPELRHGRFEVLIQPEIGRYQDVIKFN